MHHSILDKITIIVKLSSIDLNNLTGTVLSTQLFSQQKTHCFCVHIVNMTVLYWYASGQTWCQLATGRGHGSFEHVYQGPPRLIIPSPNQMFPCKYVSSRQNYTVPVYWQWYNLKSATEHNYILVRAIKISFIINGTVRLQLHLCSVASRWCCFTLLKSLLWRSLGCPHHHHPPISGCSAQWRGMSGWELKDCRACFS